MSNKSISVKDDACSHLKIDNEDSKKSVSDSDKKAAKSKSLSLSKKSPGLDTRKIVIFSMLGALMYASKLLMEFFPNIHIVGVIIVAITVVYRKQALYPIYIFVLLTGIFGGFSTWWIPYLYIWTILWGMVMILPKKMPIKLQIPIYMIVCGLHGLLYGTLYAPVQALLFGFNLESTIAWIIAGLPWDIAHAIGNFIGGLLILPIISVLKAAEKNSK